MILLKKLTSADKENYGYMENLYITAFPKEERRESNLQKEMTDNNPIFHNNLVLNEGKPIGFMTYWTFEKFYYIEHFAIDPNQRNGGFGQKVLSYLKEHFTLPIVLEVEKPNDELSTRRIKFYERTGFKLWENEYLQPPYHKNSSPIPMYLMVTGNLQPEKDFEAIKTTLYTNVYKLSSL